MARCDWRVDGCVGLCGCQCGWVWVTISYGFAAVDALHLEDLDLLLEEVGEVDGVDEEVLEFLLALGLLGVPVLEGLEFVGGLGRVLRLAGPVLAVLGGLLEVLVDGVELLEGDFLVELVEVEDADADDALRALVGAVGGAVLALLVERVHLAHLAQHPVLLVDLVLLDVLVQLLLPHLLALLEPPQVLRRVVLRQPAPRRLLEPHRRALPRQRPLGVVLRAGVEVGARTRQAALGAVLGAGLVGEDEFVGALHVEVAEEFGALGGPVGDCADEGVEGDGLVAREELALEDGGVVVVEGQPALPAELQQVLGTRKVLLRQPELLHRDALDLQVVGDLGNDRVVDLHGQPLPAPFPQNHHFLFRLQVISAPQPSPRSARGRVRPQGSGRAGVVAAVANLDGVVDEGHVLEHCLPEDLLPRLAHSPHVLPEVLRGLCARHLDRRLELPELERGRCRFCLSQVPIPQREPVLAQTHLELQPVSRIDLQVVAVGIPGGHESPVGLPPVEAEAPVVLDELVERLEGGVEEALDDLVVEEQVLEARLLRPPQLHLPALQPRRVDLVARVGALLVPQHVAQQGREGFLHERRLADQPLQVEQLPQQGLDHPGLEAAHQPQPDHQLEQQQQVVLREVDALAAQLLGHQPRQLRPQRLHQRALRLQPPRLRLQPPRLLLQNDGAGGLHRQVQQVHLHEQLLLGTQRPAGVAVEVLVVMGVGGDGLGEEEGGLEVGAEGELDDGALQLLHLQPRHRHHPVDVTVHRVLLRREELCEGVLLGRAHWGGVGVVVELEPLVEQAVVAALGAFVVALVDQVLIDPAAAVGVEVEKPGLGGDGEGGEDALGVVVGGVDVLRAVVLAEDAVERGQGGVRAQGRVLGRQLPQLPDEPQDAGGAAPREEEAVAEQVEQQVPAGAVGGQRARQVHEVLDGALAVRVVLGQHLPHQLVEEHHHLQLVEVDEAGGGGVDEGGEQQHALLGGDARELVDGLAGGQEGDGGEEGEGGEALVAEQAQEGVRAGGGGAEDEGLEQLHVVLDGVVALAVDAEALEQPLVHCPLREHVDQLVVGAVGDQQVQQLQHAQRRHPLAPQKPPQHATLAEVPTSRSPYMKNSSERRLFCTQQLMYARSASSAAPPLAPSSRTAAALSPTTPTQAAPAQQPRPALTAPAAPAATPTTPAPSLLISIYSTPPSEPSQHCR